MKNIMNVVDYTEIMGDAEKDLGMAWNHMCDLMTQDEVMPMYESEGTPRGYCRSEIENNDYGWKPETHEIMLHFINKHKVDEINVLNA